MRYCDENKCVTTGVIDLKVVRIALGGKVEPLLESPRDLPVLGLPLCRIQEKVFAACGLELVENTQEAALIVGDHVWFTEPLLRAFLQKCPPTGGQLAVSGPFWEFSKALHTDASLTIGRMPIYLRPAGGESSSLHDLPPIEVDLEVRLHESQPTHKAFEGVADQPIP